ncbi:hypothetical protein OUZ56_004110 [Daphnia magna]|uniref:Uncharacterized protein n=1 Tax=Daphnia magna TaxID=35525 RepID=A0ABQ9YNS8_9CRUS|nr:hypothetical protein OUZ56_004110 [Daphnia magna]
MASLYEEGLLADKNCTVHCMNRATDMCLVIQTAFLPGELQQIPHHEQNVGFSYRIFLNSGVRRHDSYSQFYDKLSGVVDKDLRSQMNSDVHLSTFSSTNNAEVLKQDHRKRLFKI